VDVVIYALLTSALVESENLIIKYALYSVPVIRMDLGEVGWGDVDWISLAKNRDRWRALVNSVLNLRVP
jgi:hypothetical protein